MRVTNERDMLVREIKAGYKYWDKIFAKYPLLGNAIVSENNAAKINEKAKEALDKLVETPSLSASVPTLWHQLITLATMNYAKKWNAAVESRFTKYITLQFGYRDDTGKIWGIISASLERSLSAKSRFFLKDKGGREFYETVLVHSFAPENSWDSMFELLYDFLKNNLRWNYIKDDPIIEKMVAALSAKMNGSTSDDEDLIISSMEYRIRLGAKRLLQNRPEYTAELFDSILCRINALVLNQADEPKSYVEQLVDVWFAKKISRMIEVERHQLSKTSRTRVDTALSYTKIRASIHMNEGRVSVQIPAIRLEEVGHKFAEIKIYEGEKIIGRSLPEIYGNELGETISGSNIPISFSTDSKCAINVKVICDGVTIFDSKQSMYRKFLVFKNGKECSINSLRVGNYEMYIPEIEMYKFNKTDILEQSGKYLKVYLKEDFSIAIGKKIIAMDTSNTQEATISEPLFNNSCTFCMDGEKYEIAEASDSFKIYLDKSKQGNSVKMYCNDKEVCFDKYRNDGLDVSGVCEIPLIGLNQTDEITEIVFINLESNTILYKKKFVIVDKLSVSFNRDFYVIQEDFNDAKMQLVIDDEVQEIGISSEDLEITIPYSCGEIHVTVPAINYKWKNVNNIYQGNNIWTGDLTKDSVLAISCAENIGFNIEIGDRRYGQAEINLFEIVKKEGEYAQYNFPVVLIIKAKRYKLGQLIFSEMFTRIPVFTSDSEAIYWDGGINYIGLKEVPLELQLLTEDDLKYSFELPFNVSRVELPCDFEDGEYTYQIVKRRESDELIIAQDIQFFGNPNKLRFENKTIEICEVTEDVGDGSKPQTIKPVYVEKIKFIERTFVPSEDGIFDIYEGQMYFVRPDGTKKYYSRKYTQYGNNEYYKVNPIKIIYINDKLLRIVNEEEEGLYCYDNFGTTPRLEITDREPGRAARKYKDILFYVYRTKNASARSATSTTTAVSQAHPKPVSVFDKFEFISQKEVIESDVSKRMLINAGPGTGKTWTLIEKIINMVDVQGVDPETILVLCFSRAAVDVIKGRLSKAVEEDRVSEIVNQVDVRTFDSFASQVLYWVKNESEYDNLQYYEIGTLDYETRIQLFVSLIRNLPELIEQCNHLIVDEVQDLVKERARMILEMIRCIPNESGVTLLGDSCQSIYDYQTGNDNMSSAQFYKVMCERMSRFSYYTFDRNYRQGEEIAEIGDNYRRIILSGSSKSCDYHWNNVVAKSIPRFDEYNAEKITDTLLQKLYKNGTVGVLTRTNGQALKISAVLREKGIEHVLKKRLSDNSLNKWVALIFNTYNLSSIGEIEFEQLYRSLYPEEESIGEIWNVLRDTTRNSSERLGVREILRGIVSNARNTLLYSEEKDARLTVANIHRGKGREFDTVLVEDDIFREEEKPLDEHKVCYVALTRTRQDIYRINAKAEYMRIDKDGDRRCYKADFVGFNKKRLTYFEIGVGSDLDLRSFVRMDGAQEFIRENHVSLAGSKVVLSKDRRSSDYVKYNIILDRTGMILGTTSRKFAESLSRALQSVYNLSKRNSIYFNVYPDRFSEVYIDEVISVVEQADGSENGVTVYGEMVTWNALNIVGYSKVEYI